MRRVDPKIYTKGFYLKKCLGAYEFQKTNGKKLHWRVQEMLKQIIIRKNDTILDIGCGRGDITIYLAKKAKKIIGIDYAKDAIIIADQILGTFPLKTSQKVEFRIMDAKKLVFPDNTFDIVLAIDVFEHLYPEELEICMKEIKRVLKPEGRLFIHAGTNKLLYNVTYPFYIRPVNLFLTSIDKLIKKIDYPSMPKDPRTEEEKEQHVNEPTYYYLLSLLKNHNFTGNIEGETGYIREGNSFRTKLYNFLLVLHPLSRYYPLNIWFSWVFIAQVRNKKSTLSNKKYPS